MVEVLVPIFRVRDASVSQPWYERLGFEVTGVHRFEPHFPAYMFLNRDGVLLHLSEHKGDAPKKSLAYFYVDNLEEIATEFGAAIEEAPWGSECFLTDPDGNRLRLGRSPSTTE